MQERRSTRGLEVVLVVSFLWLCARVLIAPFQTLFEPWWLSTVLTIVLPVGMLLASGWELRRRRLAG